MGLLRSRRLCREDEGLTGGYDEVECLIGAGRMPKEDLGDGAGHGHSLRGGGPWRRRDPLATGQLSAEVAYQDPDTIREVPLSSYSLAAWDSAAGRRSMVGLATVVASTGSGASRRRQRRGRRGLAGAMSEQSCALS